MLVTQKKMIANVNLSSHYVLGEQPHHLEPYKFIHHHDKFKILK